MSDIGTPEIVELPAQAMARIRLCIPRSEIRKVMGPGYRELHEALAAQGNKSTGPWFTHHFRMDPAVFDYEICLPVEREVLATGRVESGVMPAATAVRTVYEGPYEGLGEAWREFDAWIAAEGLAIQPDLMERYVTGPESGAEPARWRTELIRFVLRDV